VERAFLGLNLCYGTGMRAVASVQMLITDKDNPGVRISASDEFMEMPAVQRVSLLVAAVQLCGAAIGAIVGDNPDEEIEIRELLEAVAIQPEDQALN